MDWSKVLPWQVQGSAPPSALTGSFGGVEFAAPPPAASNDDVGGPHEHLTKGEADDGGVGSDTGSMAVLARVKRKHKKMDEEDGGAYHKGSTSNSNTNSGEWNTSNSGGSASSSEKHRVRIQYPPIHNGNNDNMLIDEERDWNENSDEQERLLVGDGLQQQQQVRQQQALQQQRQQDYAGQAGGGPQESSTSTSSSDSGRGGHNNNDDNHQLPQAAPLHYRVPAVVSEYSSSRNGSSGASNTNAMSTSGSGSGGNTGSGTGSGTASGSNQGGSSGSGNDQGGISSNGNGSSGSGNDVKGSSEENMDNSGENNSGENSGGNSDASNRPSVKVGPKVAFEAQDPSNIHRHPMHASEPLHPYHNHHAHFRDGSIPPLQNAPTDHQADDEAVREKKIQDKKRKRMNMRREYEEKVEQEMESSEASQDREVLIRPGKPITLDKVLSFTKTPRLVVKADPPFLVVYTNAAYCRLSGIDSHKVVGKPITSLMAVPDQYDLSQLGFEKEFLPPLANSIEEPTNAEFDRKLAASLHRDEEDVATTALSAENLVAAEVAGRARAANSMEDSTGVGLERLVSACGFSRLHVIKVRSQPHHMLGRNIKILKAKQPLKRSQEDGSNGSSISSIYDGPYHFVACSMSISPVVSSSEVYNAAVVTDSGKADNLSHKHRRSEQEHDHNNQHKAKRRKHHYHYHQYGEPHQHENNLDRASHCPKELPNQRRRHLISHYVIQLEPFDGHALKFGAQESQSSTSATVGADIIGQSKSERSQHQRTTTSGAAGVVGGENQNGVDNHHASDDDEMDSEMSEHQTHVSAIA
jgi:hypothetical protein